MTCREGHPAKYPDFTSNNQIARKHGVWASDVGAEARKVVTDLLPASDVERYPAVALVFAEVWVRWRRALADIDRRGMVIGNGETLRAHPLLVYADRFERNLLDLCGRFGLDPRSEAGLARDRAEATRVVADLEGVRAAGRAARLAAEARMVEAPDDDSDAVVVVDGGEAG
jgi:phage terminase small subunit